MDTTQFMAWKSHKQTWFITIDSEKVALFRVPWTP